MDGLLVKKSEFEKQVKSSFQKQNCYEYNVYNKLYETFFEVLHKYFKPLNLFIIFLKKFLKKKLVHLDVVKYLIHSLFILFVRLETQRRTRIEFKHLPILK